MIKKDQFKNSLKRIIQTTFLFLLAASLLTQSKAAAINTASDDAEANAAMVDVEHLDTNNNTQWNAQINQTVIDVRSMLKKKTDLNAKYIDLYKAAVAAARIAEAKHDKAATKAAWLHVSAIAQEAGTFASKTVTQLDNLSHKLKDVINVKFNTDLDQLAGEIDQHADAFDAITAKWIYAADKANTAASS